MCPICTTTTTRHNYVNLRPQLGTIIIFFSYSPSRSDSYIKDTYILKNKIILCYFFLCPRKSFIIPRIHSLTESIFGQGCK